MIILSVRILMDKIGIFKILNQFVKLTDISSVVKLEGGLCNQTYKVNDILEREYIVQEIKESFAPQQTEDIYSLTTFLNYKGWQVPTPLLNKNTKMHIYTDKSGGIEKNYRVYNFIKGEVPSTTEDISLKNLGEVLFRFHDDLKKYDKVLYFPMKGFHQTDLIIDNLKKIGEFSLEYDSLRSSILELWSFLRPLDLFNKDQQVIHGDTRFQNFLFWGGRAFTLIDYDTLMYGSTLIDVSDLLRSFMCDDNQENGSFNVNVVDDFLEGYKTSYSKKNIIQSVIQMSLELAARFLIDCYNDSYFGWDKKRFVTRKEHNYLRAVSQYNIAFTGRQYIER